MNIKIVHVITRFLRGGAEENTAFTCNLQIERGHDVTLIYGPEYEPEAAADLLSPQVEQVMFPELVRRVAPVSDLRAWTAITRFLRDRPVDVLHTHTSKAGVVARLAAERAKVPLVLHGIHILPFVNVGPVQERIYRAMERRVDHVTDAYVAVSRGMADLNLAAGIGTPETTFVVPSGMDIDGFRAATPTPDAPKGRLIVMVAALEARKRHRDVLEVFARLAATRHDLRLAFLGKGELENDLRRAAANLGVADQVLFLGFRPDVARWIAAADVCVLPSMREGLPRVVVQYVATGKPVVVTALPGIDAVVEDGVNGDVVPIDQPQMMEAPMARLLDDPDHAAAYAGASRAVDVSGWSAQNMEAQIEQIIQNAMAAKGVAVS